MISKNELKEFIWKYCAKLDMCVLRWPKKQQEAWYVAMQSIKGTKSIGFKHSEISPKLKEHFENNSKINDGETGKFDSLEKNCQAKNVLSNTLGSIKVG